MNVEIYGEIVKEDRKSYYLSDSNGVHRHVPKSEVKAVTKRGKGKNYAFIVSESLAKDKGFI